jgi:rubrerythrin/fructose-specific component phosphotransferase system IIB-like protein
LAEGVLPTENEDWGFFGTIADKVESTRAKAVWNAAFPLVVKKFEMTPTRTRAFLDSTMGRHFADKVLEAAAKVAGVNLRDIETDAELEKEWAKITNRHIVAGVVEALKTPDRFSSRRDLLKLPESEMPLDEVDILPSENEDWGFFGTLSHRLGSTLASTAWNAAFPLVVKALKMTSVRVQAFLDSTMGRHFADQVLNAAADEAGLDLFTSANTDAKVAAQWKKVTDRHLATAIAVALKTPRNFLDKTSVEKLPESDLPPDKGGVDESKMAEIDAYLQDLEGAARKYAESWVAFARRPSTVKEPHAATVGADKAKEIRKALADLGVKVPKTEGLQEGTDWRDKSDDLPTTSSKLPSWAAMKRSLTALSDAQESLRGVAVAAVRAFSGSPVSDMEKTWGVHETAVENLQQAYPKFLKDLRGAAPEESAAEGQTDEATLMRATPQWRRAVEQLAKQQGQTLLIVTPLPGAQSLGFASGPIMVPQADFMTWMENKRKLFRVIYTSSQGAEAEAGADGAVPAEGMDEAGGDYAGFCRQATDSQLRAIIAKEHKANRRKDRDTAEAEAKRRGWDEADIKDARTESTDEAKGGARYECMECGAKFMSSSPSPKCPKCKSQDLELAEGSIPQGAMDEVSPPGFSGTTKAMKKHGEISNPFALAWSMYKKGARPHKKKEKGKPRYVKPETYAKQKRARVARVREAVGPELPDTVVEELADLVFWPAEDGAIASLGEAWEQGAALLEGQDASVKAAFARWQALVQEATGDALEESLVSHIIEGAAGETGGGDGQKAQAVVETLQRQLTAAARDAEELRATCESLTTKLSQAEATRDDAWGRAASVEADIMRVRKQRDEATALLSRPVKPTEPQLVEAAVGLVTQMLPELRKFRSVLAEVTTTEQLLETVVGLRGLVRVEGDRRGGDPERKAETKPAKGQTMALPAGGVCSTIDESAQPGRATGTVPQGVRAAAGAVRKLSLPHP